MLIHHYIRMATRKSWSAWERDEIDRLIEEELEPIAAYGLLSEELTESLARHEAARMGVRLDDEQGSVIEQVQAHVEQSIEQGKIDATEQIRQAMHDMRADSAAFIERELRRQLGPRPESPDSATGDLFADEHDAELETAQRDYDRRSTALREKLTAETQADYDSTFGSFDHIDDEDFNPFADFDPFAGINDSADDADLATPDSSSAINNDTLRTLFRATAGALHPDRIKDSQEREDRQHEMVRLLAARKSGDALTIISLYQQYVGDGKALSKQQEKQLISTLEARIKQLTAQLEDYQPRSLLHVGAFNIWHPSKRKIEANIKEQLQYCAEQKEKAQWQLSQLTSIAKLRPFLRKSYDSRIPPNPFSFFN